MMVKKNGTDMTELMTVLLFKMDQTKTMVLTEHMEMTELMMELLVKMEVVFDVVVVRLPHYLTSFPCVTG